jgi:hypothetical protein
MKRTFLLASICLLVGSLLWAADPPTYVNYQGVLRDSAGSPLSGSHNMVFGFYDGPTSDTLLVTDAHTDASRVVVSNGLFDVALGSGSLTPPAVPFVSIFAQHQTLWMQVEIDGEVLSPRVQILAAPFAQNANTLDGYDAVSFAAAGHTHDATEVTSGTLGAGRGGTGLAGPGTSGNVLTSNGTNWVSIELPTAEMLGAVTDASDASLSRTGGGYSGNPYKLKLNLGSANTWSGAQTFGATTNFPGSGIWDGTGKVGIGTNAPDSPLQISYTQASHGASMDNRGVNLTAVAFPENPHSEHDYFLGLDCAVNGATGIDADMYQSLYGIRSSTTAPTNWHEADIFGVEANAVGGHLATGLSANASGGGGNVGVAGTASGSVGMQWGVDARAEGSAATLHVGLFGSASGGSINWAGYFYSGNVYIKNYLGIGTDDSSPPSYPLDVQAAQAVARLKSTNNLFGSVLVLDNSTTSPTYFGAINFNGGGGQVAYTGTGDMIFKTNSNEHMRLTAGGWLGIGLTPGYQLQLLFDSAAKPGTNMWTVASDRRVKKDIAPFKDGLAVIEKINPISYRYNGLGGTPADMPGIGVIAQEIGRVAPYTVGTFRAKLNEKDEATTELYNFNSHALTFVMINAIKELDERTKSLVKDTESKDSANKKSAASADDRASYAESGLLIKTTERAAQAKQSDVFQDDLGNVYGRSFRPSLAEMATLMLSSEPIEAGDLLVADDLLPGQVRLSSQAADPKVVGVATGEPGVCLNWRTRLTDANAIEPAPLPRVPVALSGIVQCKVDAGQGAIAVGDLLVASPTPGHAMRAENPAPGTVVGKALEPLASGTGPIKVLVMLR